MTKPRKPRATTPSALSQTEWATISKARAELRDETCVALVAIVARDLAVTDAAIPTINLDYFEASAKGLLGAAGAQFATAIEALAAANRDAVTFFACLAKLEQARAKYTRILATQRIPTMDQVGPRGLLQYGVTTPRALTGFMLWRKWMYDIDNRAAQETGYLFEPIIAHSIGGVPFSAKKSPVRRSDDSSKGRQVDCLRLRDKRAYEIKLRVTIAASGQGRWAEELTFPNDARTSGYQPVLVVLDPTPEPKLDELRRAFERERGEVFVGHEAWRHLESQAGPTMARFLEHYVRAPLDALRNESPEQLPTLALRMKADRVVVDVDYERVEFVRDVGRETPADAEPELPEDVDESMTGP